MSSRCERRLSRQTTPSGKWRRSACRGCRSPLACRSTYSTSSTHTGSASCGGTGGRCSSHAACHPDAVVVVLAQVDQVQIVVLVVGVHVRCVVDAVRTELHGED